MGIQLDSLEQKIGNISIDVFRGLASKAQLNLAASDIDLIKTGLGLVNVTGT